MELIHIVRDDVINKDFKTHYTNIVGVFSTYAKAEKALKDLATIYRVQDEFKETRYKYAKAYQFDNTHERHTLYAHAKELDGITY